MCGSRISSVMVTLMKSDNEIAIILISKPVNTLALFLIVSLNHYCPYFHVA